MILNFSKKEENMEFLMVLMFFVASLFLWFKPEKKRAVMGFGMGDSPCIMCWHERFCMVAISFIALVVVRYGF